ncbi:hypothetical protein C8R46DRAFT_1136584 [Mycena filopes]|nr:hypothetical protein C8R46DRAFT_1136584 [Mycena filopes]
MRLRRHRRGRLKSGDPSPPNPFPDILRTSLLALRDSADAFPPLKSAVGGVVALWDIADGAKHCQSDARAIALRAKEILDVIADAVPDASAIPDPMLRSIQRFTGLLNEIAWSMGPITDSGGFSRILHLNHYDRALNNIKAQLDDAYRDFCMASALRVEVEQARIALAHVQTQLRVEKVSESTNELLLHTRMNSFFGPPLMLPYKLHPVYNRRRRSPFSTRHLLSTRLFKHPPPLFDTPDKQPFSQARESGDITGLFLHLLRHCMGHQSYVIDPG